MAAERGMKVTATARPGSAFALCIGNSRYATSPLKNAANDAQDVAALCTALGFSTELLLEASLDQILKATGAFVKKLPRGGVAFFFYAGHGVQANDQNYLIPVEEVEDDALLKYKALSVQDVLDGMERAGSNLNLVILDACRSKPTTMRGGSRSIGRGLAKIEAHAGSVIAFACEAGHTASDGPGRNGVFTANLLKHLATPGVDVDFMLGDVAAGVQADTSGEQLPFRNHNLQGRRPCCLIEALPVLSAAPAESPSSPAAALPTADAPIEEQLAAFLERCKLVGGQRVLAAAALREIGVESAEQLDFCEADDLGEVKLPPALLRMLRAGLASRAKDLEKMGDGEEKVEIEPVAAGNEVEGKLPSLDDINAWRRSEKGMELAATLQRLHANDETLTDLNLHGNSIGDAGAGALAEALKVNKTLTTLYVRGNSICDAASASLKTVAGNRVRG